MKAWALIALLCGACAGACALELNGASQAELEQLKGVGVELSERLMKEREKAPFADWRDLIARVPGLRARSAKRLSEQGLTVQGQPFDGRER
jgi:competence protein ComEA